METFATDIEKLDFLLEADAALAFLGLEAEAADAEAEERPKYVATYIGSKQKLVDWIWRNTPEGVKSAFDAFCGSAVVGYMYKTKGLRVVANDRLRFAWHTARGSAPGSTWTRSRSSENRSIHLIESTFGEPTTR